jgi:hypothetical protein
MATIETQKTIKTVKDLKAFIENIPDDIPICGDFFDDVDAFLFKAEKGESGPRRYMLFD